MKFHFARESKEDRAIVGSGAGDRQLDILLLMSDQLKYPAWLSNVFGACLHQLKAHLTMIFILVGLGLRTVSISFWALDWIFGPKNVSQVR